MILRVVILLTYQVNMQVKARLITTSLTVSWCSEPSTNSNTPKTDITNDTKTALLTLRTRHSSKTVKYMVVKMYTKGMINNTRGSLSGLVFVKKINPKIYKTTK